MPDGLINIHAVLPRSRVNGPGARLVVFFQGCARGCKGCFNPGTHPMEERELVSPGSLLDKYVTDGIEGLTVSGGEPFLQPRALSGLLRLSKQRGLSNIVYSGFRLEELEASHEARPCLDFIDVLVDGPFEEDKAEKTLLARGSANQRFNFLTGRYGLDDFVMQGKVELTISRDGIVTQTGFSRIGPETILR